MASITQLNVTFSYLPDTNDVNKIKELGFVDYGRFSISTRGETTISGIQSSHPSSTKTGWYWAVDSDGNITISSRGVAEDTGELLENDNALLNVLLDELVKRHIAPRVKTYRVLL